MTSRKQQYKQVELWPHDLSGSLSHVNVIDHTRPYNCLVCNSHKSLLKPVCYLFFTCIHVCCEVASNRSFRHAHAHYRCVLPTSTVDYGSAVNLTTVTFCTAPHCMHGLFILSFFFAKTQYLSLGSHAYYYGKQFMHS